MTLGTASSAVGVSILATPPASPHSSVSGTSVSKCFIVSDAVMLTLSVRQRDGLFGRSGDDLGSRWLAWC
jgi:hypothetical protein